MIQEKGKAFVADSKFGASSGLAGCWKGARKKLTIVMRVATHVIEKFQKFFQMPLGFRFWKIISTSPITEF